MRDLEGVADPAQDAPGTSTSFTQSVDLQPGETVVFSWIVSKSREERDRINAAIMEDPRLRDSMDPANCPFDGKRMFWGDFVPRVVL